MKKEVEKFLNFKPYRKDETVEYKHAQYKSKRDITAVGLSPIMDSYNWNFLHFTDKAKAKTELFKKITIKEDIKPPSI